MRLYCVSQILRKGQIICSDLQSAGDTQTLNMQSVTSTIMSIHTVVISLKPICADKEREGQKHNV